MTLERSRSLEFKVGVFISVGTLVLLIFLMLMGGDKVFFARSTDLHVIVDETLGLAKGAAVQVAGLPCGNVKDITFDQPTGRIQILLRIPEKCMDRVTKGSLAAIQTQGALGDKYIAIKPGPLNAPRLKNGDDVEANTEPDLLSTLGRSGGKFEHVFNIIENMDKFFAELNQKQTAKQLADLVTNLKSASKSLDDALENKKLKSALDSLASVLDKVDRGEGTLGKLINDPTVHEDLKTILGGAKRSKLLKFLIRNAIQKGEEEQTPQANK